MAFSKSLPYFQMISHDFLDVRAQLANEKLTFGARIGRTRTRLAFHSRETGRKTQRAFLTFH